jgi:hypothetical protein
MRRKLSHLLMVCHKTTGVGVVGSVRQAFYSRLEAFSSAAPVRADLILDDDLTVRLICAEYLVLLTTPAAKRLCSSLDSEVTLAKPVLGKGRSFLALSSYFDSRKPSLSL